ncbi:MAG: helix-turn-helix transcriptional regulator [Lachnospiraceae bacterium]|nr:helix-turn-helix transcriptional regulator [Lachnospiraceae bacterium]
MDEGIRRKLKKLRTDHGMTQDTVAKILHTTRQRYARMENGQADIPFQDIRMLADIFGISTADLTAEDQKETIQSMILHQKPELLKRYGLERLMALLRIFEEQERIYYQKKKNAAEMERMEPGRGNLYGLLKEARRPFVGTGNRDALFVLLEQAGLEVIRYPICEDDLLGLLVFNGNGYTLITNTCSLAEKERQVGAFLAGIYFSKGAKQRQFLYCVTGKDFAEVRKQETEAAGLAEELLLPEYELMNFIRYELEVNPCELRAIHIMQIQLHFLVSYEFTEYVLKKRGLVSEEQIKRIQKGRRYYGEERLAKMLGSSMDALLLAKKQVYIPHRYTEHLLSNFEMGYVPFIQLEKAMNLMQISVSELVGLRKPQDDRDDWDDNWE